MSLFRRKPARIGIEYQSPEWRLMEYEARERLTPVPVLALPPYDPGARCPKCRAARAGTAFQPGWHALCPLRGNPVPTTGYLWFGAFPMEPDAARRYIEMAAESAARVAAIPEHLDRVCRRCGYDWVEGVKA